MKKILVPVDFSLAAKAGFDAAVQVASILRAEVFVLNIHQKSTDNYSLDISLLLRQEAEKERVAAMNKFTGNFPNLSTSDDQIRPKISTEIRYGEAVSEIIAYSEKKNIDLIVIGTKAKHNLWEYLFGSVSTTLIKKSKIPVLIVPEGLPFKKPKNIAFANDFMVEGVTYKYLKEFAAVFGAEIQQVHVNIMPSDFSDLKVEVIEVVDEGKPNYATVIRDQSVKKGLDFFIETHNIDLLALYLPERSFAEDLLHRSLSKQLALSSKIPMLIFKE